MVNITKRMHKLVPRLLRVSGGDGAAIVSPQPSEPHLTNVSLQIPNPANGYDYGARTFWRQYLPAFRYHNLKIPIQVEQKVGADASYSPTLTLQFEATTREALEQQVTQPKHSDDESLAMAKRSLAEHRQAAQRREVEGGPIARTKEDDRTEQLRTQQEGEGTPTGRGTSIGTITIKPQAAADPASPSTTAPPATLYQRSVTLGLRGRRAEDIWKWFRTVSGAQKVPRSQEHRMRAQEQHEHQVLAAVDCARVKKGIDAMRREREELKRAREAAERLQSEA